MDARAGTFVAVMAAAACVNLASSCKARPEPVRAGAALTAAFERDTGFDYIRCADGACLAAHGAACRPAHLHEEFRTLHAAPAFSDTYVRPTDGGCEGVEFSDHSLDAWGKCRVHRLVCPSVANLRGQNWDPRRCTEAIVHESPVCERPPWR